MRREILFKGRRVNWRELPKEEWWVKGYLWVGNDFSCIIPHNVGITYNDKSKHVVAFAYEVDTKTICEYTGSTGKNGRKIFEGDIVRYIDEVIEKEKVDEVKYNETHAAFCRLHKSKMGLQYLWLNEAVANKCEVIGNIFDNPELLGSRLKE